MYKWKQILKSPVLEIGMRGSVRVLPCIINKGVR